MYRLLSGLALCGATVATALTALPIAPSLAQTNQGINLFGGVESEFRLPYTLRNNQPRSPRAIYHLRVPGDRMERAASHLRISYPEAFTNRSGAFDPDQITVRRGRGTGGAEISVDEVVWTPESSQLDIYLTEAIPIPTVLACTALTCKRSLKAMCCRAIWALGNCWLQKTWVTGRMWGLCLPLDLLRAAAQPAFARPFCQTLLQQQPL
jgi:hypothetical protein